VGPVRFNEAQQRRLLASARHADKLLGEIEQILRAADSKSPFPKYRPDVAPHQALLLASHIARFRNHLSRVLTAAGIEHDRPPFSALHAIRVTLAFVRIAVEEMAPEHLRGYGELPETAAEYLRGLSAELEGLSGRQPRLLPASGRCCWPKSPVNWPPARLRTPCTACGSWPGTWKRVCSLPLRRSAGTRRLRKQRWKI
jgi:hypothetical protein